MIITLPVYLITAVVAFGMACAIGAQDVSHAFATSVMLIGSACEFLGSLFGGEVAGLISSGVLRSKYYEGSGAIVQRYGAIMLCTIAGAVTWMIIATFKSWPVSSTHSLVGSLLGLGIYIYSLESINVVNVGSLFASWLVSPFLGGVIAFLLYHPIHHRILHSADPTVQSKRYMPFFFGGTYGVMVAFLLIIGPPAIRFRPVVGFVVGATVAVCLFLWYTWSRRGVPLSYQSVTDEPAFKKGDESLAEEGFKNLMVVTACIVSFAHGSNDVSNSIGPFTAISEIYHSGTVTQGSVPIWILMYGGVGIVVGLILYGHRVMKTIGDDIIAFTFSRGYASQLATAITVLTATQMGLSVATTHCLIGSIMGVAFVEGSSKLNWKTVQSIVRGWIITIPAAALFAVAHYIVFSFFIPV